MINTYSIDAGQYAIFNWGATDGTTYERYYSESAVIAYRNDVEIVDTIFKLPSGTDLSTISSLELPEEGRSAIGLERGGEYTGTITVPDNNILFYAYGTGAKPKIYGSEVITGWTLHSGNIWKVTVEEDIYQVFANNERMKLASYPSEGFFNITTVPTSTSFTSDSLELEIDYTGAKVRVINSISYWFSSRDIVSDVSGTLTLSSSPSGGLSVGNEFLLVNKLEFLTEAGQWYYDESTKTVYLWTPNSDSPSNYEIRGSVHQTGILVNSKNNITIRDLHILQHYDNGVNAYYSSNANIVVENCEFNDFESHGVSIRGTNNVIANNKVTGVNAIGINSQYSEGTIITDNEILNTGLVENMGLYAGQNSIYPTDTQFYGIYAGTSTNQLIKHNRVINCGFNGIFWTGFNTIIEKNYIDNVCSVMTDGGSIYTWASSIENPLVTGSEVLDNIIVNDNGTAAIYMDDRTQDVLIKGNTVAHSRRALFYHDNKNVEARDNTFFDNSRVYRATMNYGGNIFENNISNTIATTQGTSGQPPLLAEFSINDNTITADYNIYIDRNRTNVFREASTATNYNLSDWQSLTGEDLNSTFTGTALSTNETEHLIYNDTKIAKTYYLNNATNVANNATGASIPTSFVLQPFTSIIVRGLNIDCILDYEDSTAPVITNFDLPATSNSLSVPVTLTASGNATEFILTTTNITPDLSDAAWVDISSTTFFVNELGQTTLYAWVRDAAGNISSSATNSVYIEGTEVSTGTQTILSTVTTSNVRRAYPITMSESGMVKSVVCYHDADAAGGGMLVGIYSNSGTSPSNRLAYSDGTAVITNVQEWQEIELIEPVYVEEGTTIWVAWVIENVVGMYYQAGSTSRAGTDGVYADGMPDPFGAATLANYDYSVYIKYIK